MRAIAVVLVASCAATQPPPAPEVSNQPDAPTVAVPRCTGGGPTIAGDERSLQRDRANREYDRGEFEAARDTARDVLVAYPCDVRMRRVFVSATCQLRDAEQARRVWLDLPTPDRNSIARRCTRVGIVLEP